MPRIPPRVASRMSVVQTRNALAAATAMAGRANLPTGGGGTGGGGASLPDQAGQAGKFLTTDGSTASWDTPAGSGDMVKADYDPTNVGTDIYAYADDAEADAITAANAYTDSEVAANSIADQAYTDAEIISLETALEAYADAGDTAVEVAANAYTDSEIAALSSVYQPLDSDLTAIAARSTTSYGLDFLELANSAAGQALLVLTIGKVVGVQFFANGGTYTPTSGTNTILLLGQGAGGGGGGVGNVNSSCRGGHGGAGETRLGVFTGITGTYAVTLPGGGNGATAGANPGLAASASTFGSLMTCNGGGAGQGNNTGLQAGTNGARGTSGSGGISLNAMTQVSSTMTVATFATVEAAPFTQLFIPTGVGTTGINGLNGKGQGGMPGQKSTGTTTYGGGSGSQGYFLVIEFGY